jgi:hypothetical protein
MPLKIERDEIDENDWAQIKIVIEESLNNIKKRRRLSLEKRISIAHRYRQYMTEALALDPERVKL